MFINKDNSTTLVPIPDRKITQHRHVRIHLSERRVLLLLIDSFIVLLAAWGTGLLWQQSAGFQLSTTLLNDSWYWFPVLIGSWWILAWFNDLYHIPSSSNKALSIMRIVNAGVLGFIIYLVAFILIPYLPPLLIFVYFLLIALPLIAFWRWTYALAFDRPPFHHRVLIVGKGKRGRIVADVLGKGPGVKCNVIGYVDDSHVAPEKRLEGMTFLGQTADLPRLTQQLRIHEIVIAKGKNLDERLFQLLVDCQMQGVKVSRMPDVYEKFYQQIPVEYIDAVWALHAMQDRRIFNRLQQHSKRILDLILVTLGLPPLMLLLLPLAIAIRLDSSGPVFYRQTRSGRGGKPFSIFKFRTMYVDAEKDGRARWATKDDPRITRVGRFLRKSRLDELPQVLNILRGEMSLIGPRPERPEFIEELQRVIPFYRTRLMVKPGLTGWAQIHYDYGNSIEDAVKKLQYDFYYIRYWSLWMDMYILFKTVGVVFKFKGT